MGALDPRITRENVLRTIYSSKRTIWSPCTTLEAMGIEWFPHQPAHNRLAMKRLLRALCEEGVLIERPHPHSHYTFKETAYERVPGLGEDIR